MLVEQPEEDRCNHRLPRPCAEEHFRTRLREAAGDLASWGIVREAVETNLAANLATVPVYAEAVGRRYDASYRTALDLFGQGDQPEARRYAHACSRDGERDGKASAHAAPVAGDRGPAQQRTRKTGG